MPILEETDSRMVWYKEAYPNYRNPRTLSNEHDRLADKSVKRNRLHYLKRLYIIAFEPEVKTEDYPMDRSYFKLELTVLYPRNSPRSQLKAFPRKEQFEIPLT